MVGKLLVESRNFLLYNKFVYCMVSRRANITITTLVVVLFPASNADLVVFDTFLCVQLLACVRLASSMMTYSRVLFFSLKIWTSLRSLEVGFLKLRLKLICRSLVRKIWVPILHILMFFLQDSSPLCFKLEIYLFLKLNHCIIHWYRIFNHFCFPNVILRKVWSSRSTISYLSGLMLLSWYEYMMLPQQYLNITKIVCFNALL